MTWGTCRWGALRWGSDECFEVCPPQKREKPEPPVLFFAAGAFVARQVAIDLSTFGSLAFQWLGDPDDC